MAWFNTLKKLDVLLKNNNIIGKYSNKVYNRLKIDTSSSFLPPDSVSNDINDPKFKAFLQEEIHSWALAIKTKIELLNESRAQNNEDPLPFISYNTPIIKFFYINPVQDIFAVVSHYEEKDITNIDIDNCVLLVKRLSCTYIDEIPLELIKELELNILPGTFLELQDILDISQYLLSQEILDSNLNYLPVIKVNNSNYPELIQDLNQFYSIKVFPTMFKIIPKGTSLALQSGDPIKGKKILKTLACTHGLSIENGELKIEETPDFNLVLQDNSNGKNYRVILQGNQYLLKQTDEQRSYNPYVLDENKNKYVLYVNNKTLRFL